MQDSDTGLLVEFIDVLAQAENEEEWGASLAGLGSLLGQMLARKSSNEEASNNILILYDVVWGLQFERTSSEQYENLRSCFANQSWKEQDKRSLDRRLRDLGFETIPSDVATKNHKRFGAEKS